MTADLIMQLASVAAALAAGWFARHRGLFAPAASPVQTSAPAAPAKAPIVATGMAFLEQLLQHVAQPALPAVPASPPDWVALLGMVQQVLQAVAVRSGQPAIAGAPQAPKPAAPTA